MDYVGNGCLAQETLFRIQGKKSGVPAVFSTELSQITMFKVVAAVLTFSLALGLHVPEAKQPTTINRAKFLSVPLIFTTIVASSSASLALSATAASGTYSDPNHPKGYRLLKIAGDKVIIEGSDSGSVSEWKLDGKLVRLVTFLS
jgi:hypothetical protein